MFLWGSHVGQHIGFRLVQKGRQLGNFGADLVGGPSGNAPKGRYLAPPGFGGLGRVLGEGGGDELGEEVLAPLAGVSHGVAHL